MAYPKGIGKSPGSGRKAGTPNKRSAGIKSFARSVLEDPQYQSSFRQRAQTGTLAPGLEVMLFHYL
jgi:hypothetical protein